MAETSYSARARSCALRAQPARALRIGQQTVERGGERGRIARRYQHAGAAVIERGRDLAHVGRDDGPRREHRFQQRERQAFRERRQHEEITCRQHRRHVGAQSEQVDPVCHAAGARLRRQRPGELAAPGDREVERRMAVRQARQRLDRVAMPLDRIQIADRHQQAIGRPERQLVAQRASRGRGEPDAIGDHLDARSADEQIPAEVIRELVRDGGHARAAGDRRPESDTPPETSGVVPAAVHRDHVGDARMPRGPPAIDGHAELVAVRDIDPVTAERRRQRPRARRRQRPIEAIRFNGDPRAGELPREPAFSLLPAGRRHSTCPRPAGRRRDRRRCARPRPVRRIRSGVRSAAA